MKIKTYRDLDHQMEIVSIERKIERDKLQRSIQNTKSSLRPSLMAYTIGAILKKKIRTLFKKKKKHSQ